MTISQDVLAVAVRELGYRELGDNRNKFGAWYGMDYQPWCAMFVSYCFYTVGLPLPITTRKGFAYCPYGVAWFKDKDRWFSTPQIGDVVFYNWSGDGVADHVGIVESINSDGSVYSIEGNTSLNNDSNGGEVMRRKRGRSVILGFGRPLYTQTPNPRREPNYPKWSGRYITLTTPYMKGNDILTWQLRMIERGWDLGSGGSTGDGDTGVFDERCFKVLKQFQTEKKLEVDGVLGSESWDAAWELPITTEKLESNRWTALFQIGGKTVWQAEESAFFYKSGMSIDADGAPNAYHPDDEGIDFLANAGYAGNWWALVLDQNGDPITQKSGDPFPGFFISTTALEDKAKNVADPDRYVDSTKIPYIVLPGNPLLKNTNVKLGDFAAVFNGKNGKLSFAIYADIGPRSELGEGSIALSRALDNEPIVNGKVRRGITKDIIYVVFPGSRKTPWSSKESVDSINKKASEFFEEWGGIERLTAYYKEFPQ